MDEQVLEMREHILNQWIFLVDEVFLKLGNNFYNFETFVLNILKNHEHYFNSQKKLKVMNNFLNDMDTIYKLRE